jgi:hypothetical protein
MNIKKNYVENLYSHTESVSNSLLGENMDIEDELLDEFDIDFYPLEEGGECNAHQYFRASHALSYLVAEKYSDDKQDLSDYDQIDFFNNRKADFEDFELESRGPTTSVLNLNQQHLRQYANLYSKICQEEGIEPSHSAIEVISMDKSDQQDAVLEILKDLDGGLSDESLDLK